MENDDSGKNHAYRSFLLCNFGLVRLSNSDFRGAVHYLGLACAHDPGMFHLSPIHFSIMLCMDYRERACQLQLHSLSLERQFAL